MPVRIPVSKILLLPFFILLLAGFAVPSDGQHGLLNIKSLAFLSCVFCTGIYIALKQRFTLNEFKLIVFLGCSFSLLLLSLLWGSLQHDSIDSIKGISYSTSQFDQFKVFWITILVIVISLYYYEEKKLTFSTFLRLAVYTNLIYSLTKIAILILSMFKVINLITFMEATGIRFVTMHMYTGLCRMQTSVDTITPFLIFFTLQSQRFGINFNRTFKTVFIIASFLSILLSFSRVLIFISLVSIFLYWLTTSLSRMMKSFALCLLLAIGTISFVGIKPFEALVNQRLHSRDNIYSDQTRSNQVKALLDEYDKNIFFGNGIGSYAKKEIRDENNPHSYEVQWIAFLMQFGLIGLTIILIPMGFIFGQIMAGTLSRIRLSLGILFVLWLLAGFTNPYLISLTSGIIYVLFILAAKSMKQPAIAQ